MHALFIGVFRSLVIDLPSLCGWPIIPIPENLHPIRDISFYDMLVARINVLCQCASMKLFAFQWLRTSHLTANYDSCFDI